MTDQKDSIRLEFETQHAPGFLFHSVGKICDAVFSSFIKDLDLTANQWPVLDQIFLHEGLSQRELAQYCMKDPSAVLKTIDAFEKKGFAVRTIDEEDRRVYKIYLTDKGRAVRNEVYVIASSFFKEMTKGLSQKELDDFYDVAITMYNNIKEVEQNGKLPIDSSLS